MVICFLVITGCSTISFILLQCWPSILDIILPKNETRPRQLLFPAEYFLDRQKYFYLMQLHMNVTITIGLATVIAILMLLFANLECICGMFAVAR